MFIIESPVYLFWCGLSFYSYNHHHHHNRIFSGNYINGDTKFGQAYGVKLDTFLKLTTLKALSAKDGTLMNYLGALFYVFVLRYFLLGCY